MNSVANVLADCVRSNTFRSACRSLFNNIEKPGLMVNNLLQAAHTIAMNPASYVNVVFPPRAASAPVAVYSPVLEKAPKDTTIALNFTGGGLSGPFNIAVAKGGPEEGVNVMPEGGEVWVSNLKGDSVTELDATGIPLSPSEGFTGGGLVAPAGVALDKQGNIWVANSAVVTGSCMPSSSLSVLVDGKKDVVAYVPRGNWGFRSSLMPGIALINVERSSITPGVISTSDVVNSCASNPNSSPPTVVCTANNTNDVYIIPAGSNPTVTTINSSGAGKLDGFSGGSCTNCGVAMDAVHNKAVIVLGDTSGAAGFQFWDSAEIPPLEQFFASSSQSDGSLLANVSEGVVIDPFRHLLLSAAENGNYEIINVKTSSQPLFFENATGASLLDSSGEDCNTGIALAPLESFSPPTSVYIADLTQAAFTSDSPGTWSAPSQVQSLSESDLTSLLNLGQSTGGLSVAQGTHTGLIASEFGGNALTAIALPTTSGSGTPSITDWVTCKIPNDPNGAPWNTGDDPHTITAYKSPSTGHAIGLLANGAISAPPSFVTAVDLTRMLDTKMVPRTVAGHGCMAGTLPSRSVVNFIAVPQL
jgi:hypothetical protein